MKQLTLVVWIFLMSSVESKVITCAVKESMCLFTSATLVKSDESLEIQIEPKSKNMANILAVKFELSTTKIIPKQLFTAFRNLENLEMVRSDIQEIEPSTFENAGKLINLNLNDNKLAGSLNLNVFYGAAKLQNLEVSSNLIVELIGSFQNKRNLVKVDFSKNQLKIIKKGQFLNADNLQELYLNQNNISKLEDDCFSGLSNLEILSLENNQISRIRDRWFNELQSLVNLGLTGNKVKAIDKSSIENLKKLKKFELNFNNLGILSEDCFPVSFTELETLSLASNNIRWIKENTFQHLRSLKILNLARNLLSTISNNSFASLSSLVDLDLQNNKLIAISHISFGYLTNLQSLRMIGNPCVSLIWDNATRDLENIQEALRNTCMPLKSEAVINATGWEFEFERSFLDSNFDLETINQMAQDLMD